LPSPVIIIPINVVVHLEQFDLPSAVWDEIIRNGEEIKDADVIVVSSKFAALSEGRLIDLSTVPSGERAVALAARYSIDPALAQLVLDDSEKILGGIPGFVLSIVGGTLAPNAGYDHSNVPKGFAVQYPKDPNRTARSLREKLISKSGEKIRNLGVILSDSRVTPTRLGTVGVAVGFAGLRPVLDMRGKPDLLGNKLVVTLRAVADQIATAAQLVMGESDESRPITIIRGFTEAFGEPTNESESRMTIDSDRCLILNGLRNPPTRLF
jgi:coenzyme F420-0:L-glutamate ligase / coenzyme F420-1:gamma-L-glutamate ligase